MNTTIEPPADPDTGELIRPGVTGRQFAEHFGIASWGVLFSDVDHATKIAALSVDAIIWADYAQTLTAEQVWEMQPSFPSVRAATAWLNRAVEARLLVDDNPGEKRTSYYRTAFNPARKPPINLTGLSLLKPTSRGSFKPDNRVLPTTDSPGSEPSERPDGTPDVSGSEPSERPDCGSECSGAMVDSDAQPGDTGVQGTGVPAPGDPPSIGSSPSPLSDAKAKDETPLSAVPRADAKRCEWPVFSPSFWPREVRTPRCDVQL